jgi:hypothetical protein
VANKPILFNNSERNVVAYNYADNSWSSRPPTRR